MRSHFCGQLTTAQLDQTVTICGWVNTRRDHGGVIFIDVRDKEGLVQAVFNPEAAEMFKLAGTLRNEFCIKVVGRVIKRDDKLINPKLKTGEIEIVAQELEILNASITPPFQLDEENLSETTRLTHRVLDLRRPQMQHNMKLRYKTAMAIRQFLDANDFIDIETPMLTKSTPEGARDYLVPSRVHDGQFFALPQSPQLFKQMLMVAGFDRYYQIVKCFRDEDLRADRQPEFTQVDTETSFMSETDIRSMFEGMIRGVFKDVLNVELAEQFPSITYDDAMHLYGSDKPDMRIKLQFTELTDVMKSVDFKVFNAAANMEDGRVVALCVPNGAELSRSEIDAYTQFVAIYGARGLAYIKVNELEKGRDGLQSPIVKNIDDDALAQILERTAAKNGDIIFFGADKAKIVNDAIGALRIKIGHEKGHASKDWQPLWVVDFPMFERDDEAGRWTACHHPFTAPKDGHEDLLTTNPGKCIAKAYDMVLNGSEIGGGSVRIHREDVQSKVFRALNINAEEAQEKFGFLLDALQYGAPPHGGIAFGLDRIVTMMTGAESIRDVIAFPKTQRAQCLLTAAPSPVDGKRVRERHIRLRKADVKLADVKREEA